MNSEIKKLVEGIAASVNKSAREWADKPAQNAADQIVRKVHPVPEPSPELLDAVRYEMSRHKEALQAIEDAYRASLPDGGAE